MLNFLKSKKEVEKKNEKGQVIMEWPKVKNPSKVDPWERHSRLNN